MTCGAKGTDVFFYFFQWEFIFIRHYFYMRMWHLVIFLAIFFFVFFFDFFSSVVFYRAPRAQMIL